MAETTDRPVAAHRATAEAEVEMAQETLSAIVDGSVAKGDVLSVAELAGVIGGKRTAELIPLAHPAALTQLVVSATPDRAAGAVRIRAETAATGRAGVEMEALTAAAVAALTVYDMIRDIDPGAAIRTARLVASSGGDAEEWRRPVGPADSPRPPRGVRVAGRIAPSSSRGGPPHRPPPRGR
ncbi:MAG: cyclic pyranopterin monophosphate synthase MoaC [Candidatus Limnocylindrales bacterium]|jgi:cyclic pyranopterin phosphate synthase